MGAIKDALDELRGKVTTIIIASRASTIANVDRLLVVKDGEIKEDGKPCELINNPNSYFAKISAESII
jgi:ABC-type multidrug transport system fused ATPase/permease subunit